MLFAAVFFAVCVTAAPVLAAGGGVLIIKDATGVERAHNEVTEVGKVEFSLTDASGAPAQNAEITLTNAATGDVITTQAVNGVAAFEGIAPGTWTVASITPGITFTDISLGGASAATVGGFSAISLSTAAVAGGAVAVTGATVGIVALTDDSKKNDPISPST